MLKSPKETTPSFQRLIHPATFADGFTQSEFSDMSCMQRWNYRYNQRLHKPGVINFPFMIGSVFHDAMEQFYATKGARVNIATLQFDSMDIPSVADEEELIYWNHVLPCMLEAYQSYYKADPVKWKIYKIELELSVEFKGFILRAKIDLVIDNGQGNWIVDHKTTSRLNKFIVAGWDFRFQFMFYIWLLSKTKEFQDLKIKGFIVNAVKKPELRVKKNESVPEFAQRVKQDMIIEPDKYYYREPYLVSKGALAHFEKVVVDPKIKILNFLKYSNTFTELNNLAEAIVTNKNTDECQKYGGKPCEYIEICQHGMDKMGFIFRKREQKHLELEN